MNQSCPLRLYTMYIAGPMSGIKDHNFPMFHRIAARYRARCWTVINPAENHEGRTDLKHNDYLKVAIPQVAGAWGMVLLPGWEKSAGVWTELAVARACGVHAYRYSLMTDNDLRLTPAEIDAHLAKPMPGTEGVELPSTYLSDAWRKSRERLLGPDFPMPPGDNGEPLMTAAEKRKARPVCTGVLDYFPDAIQEVAHCSKIGNDQHNAGQPLHWAKEKSTDEADALTRHLLERGTLDTDGVRHSAKVAWRALALLQREIDKERAK